VRAAASTIPAKDRLSAKYCHERQGCYFGRGENEKNNHGSADINPASRANLEQPFQGERDIKVLTKDGQHLDAQG
jgi:hypothetical protein